MKHRKPFNVKPFAVVHNAVMFSLSLYMVIETLSQSYVNFGWAKKLTPWGNMVETPGSSKFSPSGYRLARVLWIHYLSKVYEFADTAIMVLKKNERQISFLHVYHHASTFFPCWCVWERGGEGFFPRFLRAEASDSERSEEALLHLLRAERQRSDEALSCFLRAEASDSERSNEAFYRRL